MHTNIKYTLILLASLALMPRVDAMQAVVKASTAQTAGICISNPDNSLKTRAAHMLANQLLAGTIDVKEAQKTWPPDLVDVVKEQLLYDNMLFFTNLFKGLGKTKPLPSFPRSIQKKNNEPRWKILASNGRF